MSENINIKSDKISYLARGQAVVEAKQPLDRECRILSATVTASATPVEIFSGEARYIGKAVFDCLVLADGEVQCITAVAEFSDKIVAPEIVTGMPIILSPEVINVETSTDGGMLKAVAVVDTFAIAVVSAEYSCIGEPDGDIFAEKHTAEYCTATARQTETVYISDSASSPKISEILFAASRAAINSAETLFGEIKISGTLYSDVTVRTEDRTVTSIRIVTPFVKNIAAQGVSDGNAVFASVQVADVAATPNANESRIDLAATLYVGVIAVERCSATAVTDVFCADYEIEQKSVAVECRIVEPLVTVADTVDGQVPIAPDRLAADNVLCVTGVGCTLSSVKVENKTVVAEGLVFGDIIYYNAEKNTVDTLAFRLPFGMPLSIHTEAQAVNGTATITDVTVKVRRESVFDIKAGVVFTLSPSSTTECVFAESIKRGAAIEKPNATVIVHIAKAGETLWQAAKALCCAPDIVERQNNCAAPYSGGERLVNFCGKQ